MYCRLKNNEAVEIKHNGYTYLCEKNCCEQGTRCDDCSYEDCMEGCEVYDLLGSCDKCDLCR